VRLNPTAPGAGYQDYLLSKWLGIADPMLNGLVTSKVCFGSSQKEGVSRTDTTIAEAILQEARHKSTEAWKMIMSNMCRNGCLPWRPRRSRRFASGLM